MRSLSRFQSSRHCVGAVSEVPAVYVETNNFQSSYWAQEVVQQDDSLADVLARMGGRRPTSNSHGENSADQNMQRICANQSVNIRVDSSGRVTDVQFFTDENWNEDLSRWEKSQRQMAAVYF